jgi:hypothetical protein
MIMYRCITRSGCPGEMLYRLRATHGPWLHGVKSCCTMDILGCIDLHVQQSMDVSSCGIRIGVCVWTNTFLVKREC